MASISFDNYVWIDMKKTLLTLLICASSPSAFAVVNGASLDWSEHNNTAYLETGTNPDLYCTGTLVGGRFIVTAAHCVDDSFEGQHQEEVDTINTYYGLSKQASIEMHPDWEDEAHNCLDGRSQYCNDIAFLHADEALPYDSIQYFIETNPYTATHFSDPDMDTMTIAGFGGTPYELNQADFTTSAYNLMYGEEKLEANMVNSSHTTGGDSGSAWINSSNEIIAIHRGSAECGPDNSCRRTYGTNIDYVRPFILEAVNGWHYPTVVRTSGGQATITLQSLHQTSPTLADRQADITSDHLDAVNSTCLTKMTMQPFEKCTVVIDGLTDGELSTVYLGGSDRDGFSQEIQLNASMPTPEMNDGSDQPVISGSSSGGSIGFLSLFGLGLLGRLRKKEG